MTLREKYEEVTKEYIVAFENKQDISFIEWFKISPLEPPYCASFKGCDESYVVYLTDIIFDVDNEVEKGKIFEWQESLLFKNIPFCQWCEGLKFG